MAFQGQTVHAVPSRVLTPASRLSAKGGRRGQAMTLTAPSKEGFQPSESPSVPPGIFLRHFGCK